MFKHILVATDGSDHAYKAVTTAGEMAAKLGAELTILHARSHHEVPESLMHMAEVEDLIDEPRRAPGEQDGIEGRAVHDLMAVAPRASDPLRQAKLAEVLAGLILERAVTRAKQMGAGAVRALCSDETPANFVLEQAGILGVDLIVLGTRGLGSVQSLLLGSVSNKIVHNAPCSCLTVR